MSVLNKSLGSQGSCTSFLFLLGLFIGPGLSKTSGGWHEDWGCRTVQDSPCYLLRSYHTTWDIFMFISIHGFIHRLSRVQQCDRLLHATDTEDKADFTFLCLHALSSHPLEWKGRHWSVANIISSHQHTKACTGTGWAEKSLVIKANICWKILVCFSYSWMKWLCYPSL